MTRAAQQPPRRPHTHTHTHTIRSTPHTFNCKEIVMKQPFHTLIDLAKQRSDEAAVRLGSLMAQARDSEYKSGTLAAYRDDYRARLELAMRAGTDAAGLRNFQGFLSKLDEAVRQQSVETERWRQTVETARHLWQEELKRMRSYSVIQARRDHAASRQTQRSEQKQQDERSARRSTPMGGSSQRAAGAC